MWTPTKDRLIVQVDQLSDVTEAGIVLPGNKHKQLPTGIILKRGDEALYSEGTRVFFSTHAGIDIQLGEGGDAPPCKLMSSEDILAIQD